MDWINGPLGTKNIRSSHIIQHTSDKRATWTMDTTEAGYYKLIPTLMLKRNFVSKLTNQDNRMVQVDLKKKLVFFP